jgi:acyl-CoA thioester hydrolase
MPETKPLEARIRVGLRWRDLDMLGHVNQSVYHELLEEGRAALFGQLGLDLAFVLARVELDYVHEVRRDHGEVELVVRTASVGRTSIVVENDVLLPDGTVAATGRSVLVAWDPAERGKRELTDAERAALGAPTGATRPAPAA